VRTLSLVSVLAALAVAGYLVSAQWRSAGPTSETASTAAVVANGEVATLTLQQAALALEQHRAATGGYAAVDLGGFGLVLRRATPASYCVETVRAPIFHLAGPGGTPTAGGC
jgi:hypothetical protein